MASSHAELLAFVRRRGRPRGAHELIIAATAEATRREVLSADSPAPASLPASSSAPTEHATRPGRSERSNADRVPRLGRTQHAQPVLLDLRSTQVHPVIDPYGRQDARTPGGSALGLLRDADGSAAAAGIRLCSPPADQVGECPDPVQNSARLSRMLAAE